jgi:hypothetical protein
LSLFLPHNIFALLFPDQRWSFHSLSNMRAAIFCILIAFSMGNPTALEPRYYTKHCKKLTTQKECEQGATTVFFGPSLPVGKGYACAWTGTTKKCKHTQTPVDWVTPDPSKFTKSITKCDAIQDEAMCNASFSSSLGSVASPCHWSGGECSSHDRGFSYDQTPAGAILDKLKGKHLVYSCFNSGHASCDQTMIIQATTSKGKICSKCYNHRSSGCATNDASRLYYC